MRIGIDGREIRHYLTGLGRVVLDLLRYSENYSEFEFFLFGNQYTDFSKIPRNVKTYMIEENITFLWDQIVLNNLIKEHKIDLFFSPYYKVPLMCKIPMIMSVHDITYLIVEPYKKRLKNKFFIKNFIKIASKKVKNIVTCSNYTKNDLINLLKIKEEKIVVVYDSISERFSPRSEKEICEFKKKYNINKKYILYVGNSNPHKNLSRLITAYNNLPEKIKEEYFLVLAGVGKKFLIKDDKILAIPFVSEDDLPALYSGATIFVFPSLYEGFGLPPAEAMACGCPVVSSNVSSMPEVLGDACLYFNPYNVNEIGSTIQMLIENKYLQYELRQKGLNRVKIFTPENMIKNLLNIFSL